LIENAITDYPIIVANQEINAGSWYCVIEVDNEKMEQMLINEEIKGFSLFSYANGATSYNDVLDTSDVHPLFISFVEYPANQVLFEVLDREMYISKMEAVKMADEDKSLLDKLKELLSSYDEKEVSKAEEETEKVEEVVDEEEIEKSDDTKDNEESDKKEGESEENSEEAVKKEDTEETEIKEDEVVEESTVKKEEEVEEVIEEEVPEVVEQKEQISNADVLEAIIQLTKVIKEFKAETETVKENEPVSEEPETYIIKQATTKVDNVVEENNKKQEYFDILGRKL